MQLPPSESETARDDDERCQVEHDCPTREPRGTHGCEVSPGLVCRPCGSAWSARSRPLPPTPMVGPCAPGHRHMQAGSTELEITSHALEGNPLGDSPRRPLYVYLPPGYDDEPSRRYPSRLRAPGLLRSPARLGSTARTTSARPIPRWPTSSSASGVGAPVHRRVRRRLDLARRQPVRRLARHGPLPHLPVRRRRHASSTPTTAPSTTPPTAACRASPRAASGR